MEPLKKLFNIGEALARKLEKIGVNSYEGLFIMGSENAILKINTLENGGACLNMLYALEGAIQKVRWHHLPMERKQELKDFFHTLKATTKYE